jgi:hypothetical protein
MMLLMKCTLLRGLHIHGEEPSPEASRQFGVIQQL